MVYGLVGVFLLRAPIAYLAMVVAIILFWVPKWERLKRFDPKRDTSEWFGMPVIEFEEDKKAKAESPKMVACSHCGAEYNPKDYL